MHVLFVHPNFPAQFGHVAAHLARAHGWRCTFVSETPPGRVDVGAAGGSLEKIQYKTAGGARPHNHFCTRTFENAVWHTDAVYQALLARLLAAPYSQRPPPRSTGTRTTPAPHPGAPPPRAPSAHPRRP